MPGRSGGHRGNEDHEGSSPVTHLDAGQTVGDSSGFKRPHDEGCSVAWTLTRRVICPRSRLSSGFLPGGACWIVSADAQEDGAGDLSPEYVSYVTSWPRPVS